jgi:hypothetical protein
MTNSINRKVLDAYGSCRSYSDKGAMSAIVSCATGTAYEATLYEFQTTFAMPWLLRFSWKRLQRPEPELTGWTTLIFDLSRNAAMYMESGDSYKITQYDSLASAVAGATGVSGMSVHAFVPLLLEAAEPRLFDVEGASFEGEDMLDGCLHYRLSAPHKFVGQRTEGWISVEDNLLHQIKLTESGVHVPSFFSPDPNVRYETSTIFKLSMVELNEPIDEDAFHI